MTRKEAILLSAYTGFLLVPDFSEVHKFCEDTLGRPIWTHEFADSCVQKEIQEKLRPQIMELVQNIAALRPVSRERVELYTNRLWPGCPRCSMTNDEAFDAGGAHEFRVLDDSLYYCDSNYGWEGEKIGYCPWCGKPLGKATELKHIEKLEVLLND